MQVISHNNGRGARALSERISNGRLLLKRSTRQIPARTVVNFGVQNAPRLMAYRGRILNQPERIRAASDKSEFLLNPDFQCRRPHATTDRNEVFLSAQQGDTWFARTLTRADSGRGIEVIEPSHAVGSPSVLPRAPLYVQEVQKRKEYRVHLGLAPDGTQRIIDVRRKARRSELNNQEGGRDNWPKVWNHDNGFVFKIGGVTPSTVPEDVLRQAGLALADVNLDFGAIDVVWDGSNAYTLEVNTAPGLEGRTLDRYAEFFRMYEGGSFTPWAELDHE